MAVRLGVVICTWNRADLLAATLDSLAAQHLPDDCTVDVLVVDNNSQDDTLARLKARAPAWQLGRLHALCEPRQGKQFALNTAIRRARELGCELLAFSDDDILFPPDWLVQACTTFRDGATALAGGRTLLEWPPTGRPAWYDDSMAAIVGGVDLGEQRLAPPPPGYAPAGANLVARASLFERVGGFSEAHFRHMDAEFGQRCLARGEVLAYEPQLQVTAPVDPAMLTRRYFRRWSFKSGISDWQDLPASQGLPLWVYRRLVQDALLWLLAPLLCEPPPVRFARELRIWRARGAISASWMSRLRPAELAAWVDRRSRKRNLF